jgi:hypothetical protein
MRIEASGTERAAILGAMRAVALVHGAGAVTDADRATIAAAARIVLGSDPIDPDAVAPATPQALLAAVGRGPLAREAVRLAAVMALVDGSLDAVKVDLVAAYAAALGIEESYVTDLTRAAHGHLTWAIGHMVRENMASITNRPWSKGVTDDVLAWLLPYRDAPDPALAARFHALAGLPEATFGRHFHRHFAANGYAFPGETDALNAEFSLPHDSAHVLSGYDTSPAGEILVSTFTAAMHPENAMAAHVLPVILSWHLGIKFNDVAKSATGAFAPASFFEAWERGGAATVDLFSGGWDFWAAAEADLEALRERYAIPPRREED